MAYRESRANHVGQSRAARERYPRDYGQFTDNETDDDIGFDWLDSEEKHQRKCNERREDYHDRTARATDRNGPGVTRIRHENRNTKSPYSDDSDSPMYSHVIKNGDREKGRPLEATNPYYSRDTGYNPYDNTPSGNYNQGFGSDGFLDMRSERNDWQKQATGATMRSWQHNKPRVSLRVSIRTLP